MKVIKNKNYSHICFATSVVASTLLLLFPPVFPGVNAVTGTDKAEADTKFTVNVAETLTMTVTPPSATASGKSGKLLREKVNVSVATNNSKGFSTTVTTKDTDTNLKNGATTIPTTSGVTCKDEDCSAFTANFWGISLNDTIGSDATKGSASATYSAVPASNAAGIKVLGNATNTTSMNKDVIFAAKTDNTKAAGTYTGTVTFKTTSGTGGTGDPVIPGPSNPGNPDGPSASQPQVQPSASGQEQPSAEAPQVAYSYTTNNNTYRSTSSYSYSSDASETADEVDENSSSRARTSTKKSTSNNYVAPLGANNRQYASTTHLSVITIILMIIACLAAAFGIFFFILAKRRKDDEEDDPTVL